MNHVFLETRMFRLSDGEEIMTLAFFVLIQYRSVTDGRTDERTDRRTDMPPLAIPAVCIARYANALVKTNVNDMPNTHRRRRRDETVLSRRVGGVNTSTNSQLVGDSFVVSSV